jgi:hypothetical protein
MMASIMSCMKALISLFATYVHKRILAQEPGVLSERLDRICFA